MYNFARSRTLDTILFYPQFPTKFSVISRIISYGGWWATNRLKTRRSVVFFWQDTTFKKINSEILELSKYSKIVNINCKNISKVKVNNVFKKIFGYGVGVSPYTYKGKVIVKSNINASHDGEIINCPIRNFKQPSATVCQRFINTIKKGYLVDIRIPIFENDIPFVYLNYRTPRNKFKTRINKVEIVKNIKEVLSEDECTKIIAVCRSLGLDYGELDVLREKHTGKLYVVDVNSTPSGPDGTLRMDDYKWVMNKLTESFDNFIDDYRLHIKRNKKLYGE